jgi:PAS domain S-box-containing protein
MDRGNATMETKFNYEKPRIEKPVQHKIRQKLSNLLQFEKHDLYRLIVEKAYEGIVVAQGGKLCFVNKRTVELTGYSRQELRSKDFIEFIHHADRAMAIGMYTRRLKGEDVPYTYTVRIVTKEEEIKWVQATSIKINWEGQPAVLGFLTDVSAQKQAKTALKESEKRYRNIVDNSLIGIYETNLKGDILYINDTLAKIFEWESPEKAIGQNVETVYKDIRDRDAFLKILKKNGNVENFEFEFVTKTGKHKNAIVTAVLHGDNITGMLMDISQRKETEEALRESRKTMDTLINSTHDFALLIDVNGVVLALNNMAAASYRMQPHDLIGKNIFEITAPDLATARGKVVLEVVTTKRPVNYIEEHKGQILDINMNPVPDKEGNVQYLAIFAKDITELKNAEDALKESEKQYRNIVDNSLIGIYETNLKGDILYINEALAKIFEYESSAEMIPSGVIVLYKDIKDRMALIEKLKKTGRAKNFEFEALTKSGKTKNILVSAVLEGDNISGMLMDISERKKAEEALKKSHGVLEYRVAERTQELSSKTRNLEEVNTALQILLQKRDEDRKDLEERLLGNVKELALPYLQKMKGKIKGDKLNSYLNILESNLNNIISPFSQKLSAKYLNLTPAEIEIADLVKHAKSTKEIADLLNISGKTVETHRVNIRKKLGITNKKANLRTYLLSIQE